MSELTFTKAGARAISRRMVDRSAYRRNLVRRTALGVYIISCIAISSSLLSESDDVWLGGATSVVAWLLFGLFLRSLHRTDRRFLPSAFYTVFYVAGMLVSATVINSGAYMFEVGEFGTANGTLWIALLLGIGGQSLSVGLRPFPQTTPSRHRDPDIGPCPVAGGSQGMGIGDSRACAGDDQVILSPQRYRSALRDRWCQPIIDRWLARREVAGSTIEVCALARTCVGGRKRRIHPQQSSALAPERHTARRFGLHPYGKSR